MTRSLSVRGELATYPAPDIFAMAVPLESLGAEHEPSSAIDWLSSGQLCVAGRSALVQMGIGLSRNFDHEPIISGTDLYVPAKLDAHSPIGEQAIADLEEIRTETRSEHRLLLPNEEVIEIGRLINMGRLRRLEKDEVEYIFSEALISINTTDRHNGNAAYRIKRDGSVTMPISLVETFINEFTLGTPEERFNVFEHGRAGLIPHTDTEPRQPSDRLPQGFFIGGIPLSPGPYHCIISEQLDQRGQIRQLPEAAHIDGNRIAGNGRHLDSYTGNRQIEVVNNSSRHNFGDTTVTINIYRDTQADINLHPAVDWWDKSMDIEKRNKLHERGINPLDVIKVSNPYVREQLLETAQNAGGGIVVSSHGASSVPAGKTPRQTAQNVNKVARSFGQGRSIDEELGHLEGYSRALSPAGDRSRIFIGPKLDAEHMSDLVTSGDIRSFMVQNFGDIAMRKQVHSALVNLVQKGVSIGWDNGGELREFHRNGLFVKPEFVDQMESLELIWAMYGSHLSQIDAKLKPQVEELFQLMSGLMPVEKMGVTHGNGPGIMLLADQLARAYGMLSMGVGIDVEDIGQGQAKLVADAVAFFKRTERLYRQEMMDKFRNFAIFSVGGFGTLEELAITLCTNKLNLALPSPSIVVDPDNLYTNVVKQVEDISTRPSFDAWGQQIDLRDKPLGQPWVSSTVHHVKNYVEAFKIVEAYWTNPTEYWTGANIPAKEIHRARAIQSGELIRMGMRLAPHLDEHARNYDGPPKVA